MSKFLFRSHLPSCVEHMDLFTWHVNGAYYWVCTCNKTCYDSCQMIWFETLAVYPASAPPSAVSRTVSNELRPNMLLIPNSTVSCLKVCPSGWKSRVISHIIWLAQRRHCSLLHTTPSYEIHPLTSLLKKTQRHK